MGLFQPDRYFSRVTDIHIYGDLLNRGRNAVLIDIDNTVRSRETGAIPRDVGIWMGKARDAGVKFCLLSNNWHANVQELADELDLPIVGKACKPLVHGYLMGMRKLGAKRSETVAIGDQLLTDVVGAHLVGIPAYMVMPLATVDLKHTLALRGVERALMGDIEPEGAPVVAFESLD